MFAIKADFGHGDIQVSTKLFESRDEAQSFIDGMDRFERILAKSIEIIAIPTLF